MVVVEDEDELAESAIELDVLEEPEEEVDEADEEGELSCWLGELVGTVSSFAMPILESLCEEPCWLWRCWCRADRLLGALLVEIEDEDEVEEADEDEVLKSKHWLMQEAI